MLAQRHEQDGQDGHGAEGGADAHGDQQTDQGDDGGGDPLVAAHGVDTGLDQGVNAAGGLHDLGVAAGNQHHEGDQAHQLHAAGQLVVDLVPLDGTEDDHDQHAAQSGQGQILGEHLDDDHDHHGHHGHIVPVLQLLADGVSGGGVGLDHLVLTGLAVQDEHRDQQADEHGDTQRPVGGGDVVDGDVHAVLIQVVPDDGHELQAEAEGDGDVGGLVAEGKTAGGRAAVQLHLVHHGQHGGDQDGDVGDVHRDQVLRQAGDDGDGAQQDQLLPADDAGELLGQDLRQAGGGDGGGEHAQQDVGQGGGGVAGEAAGEQPHDGGDALLFSIDGDTAHQAAHNTGDQHGQQHVQLQQAEDTQDDDGYGYRVSQYCHD